MQPGPEPDPDVDRKALVAVAAQFFVNGALFASFIPRLPEIRDRVDISIGAVGLLISIAAAGGLVASAVVGRAMAQLGSRRVMLIAGTLVSVSLPVIGFAQTEVVLVAGLTGMFALDVFVDVGMNMQGSWLSARRQVPVMNRLHGLWSLGTVIGGVSSSRFAAAGVSLPTHLLVAGAVLLSVLGFVSRGLLRVDEHHGHEGSGSDADRSRRGVSPVLLSFGLVGFFALAIEATAIDWVAFRFVDDFGEPASFGALGYVSVTTGMMVGRFAGDWMTVRLGGRRLTAASALVSGVGLAAASLISNSLISLIGYLAVGLGIATMLPMMYDAAAKHRARPGAGLGALTAGIRAASLTIPFVVGSLADTGLSVGSAIAIVTLPCVVGFLLNSGALNRDRSPAEPDGLSECDTSG